jgi:hypothetical protein
VRAGQILNHTVELTEAADGVQVLTWTLVDEFGSAISNGSTTPPSGAISVDIVISAPNNTLGLGLLWGGRELSWSFDGQVGFHQYRLEGMVPFGASCAGVRSKLGLGNADDLGDEEIPLLKSYLTFRDKVGAVALAAVTGDLNKMIVMDAIEASAALSLLPTLQVRVAEKESSGTNQYARGKIDWALLDQVLTDLVTAGEGLVDPALVVAASGLSLLQLVTPDTDLFPGA